MGPLRTASRGLFTASGSGRGGSGSGGGNATASAAGLAASASAWDASLNPKPGQFTRTVYGLIRDNKLQEAAGFLQRELQVYPESRAALSLLGYCSFQLSQFAKAAECYESLVRLFPDNIDYKLYYAQSLQKAGQLQEAAQQVEPIGDRSESVILLESTIKFENDDTVGARSLLDQLGEENPNAIVNQFWKSSRHHLRQGCIAYKDGDYEAAKDRFEIAMGIIGFSPDIAYAIALCRYQLKQFSASLKLLAEIIQKGVHEHPELSVGSNTEAEIEMRSVGNTATLKSTALVEAFNLKAAIEYRMKNFTACKEALADMPPRTEEELDPVTLHNHALMIDMEKDATTGFRKLNYLLQNPPFPPETFGNLLLLYCKAEHSLYDLAADVMAEHAHLTYKYLTQSQGWHEMHELRQDLYDYLDAVIMAQTTPNDAYAKLDALATRHVDGLRRFTKQIQEARDSRDNEAIKVALMDYDEGLDAFIPVLMMMGRLSWDLERYAKVERILKAHSDFCDDHEIWKLNMAHTIFMQDNKYKEAIRFYEPIVKARSDDILGVQAIVLANLCVSHIMTSQNEEAEELMRQIEKAEEVATYRDPKTPLFHLCIVNLVIGTLYCAKGNYEFGISRVIKSLEPYNKKLEGDTWYYAKRCMVSLVDMLAKHMIVVPDATFHEMVPFLDTVEFHGRGVVTQLADPNDPTTYDVTAAHEARLIKRVLLKLKDI